MSTKLAEWYNLSNLNLTEEQLKKRNLSVTEILKIKDLSFYLNLIRVYFNKIRKQDEIYTRMRDAFVKNDPLFQLSGNELELRVLSGEILYNYISKNTLNSNLICIALVAGSFGIKPKTIILPEILEYAIFQLNDQSNKLRETAEPMDATELEYKNSTITDYLHAQENFGNIEIFANQLVLSNFSSLEQKLNILAEETNMLWWVMSEYSRDMELPITDIEERFLPILLGKELADLTQFTLGPISVKGMLSKQLIQSKKKSKKIRISEAVNKAPLKWREENSFSSKLSTIQFICPLYIGIIKSLETENTDDWKPAYMKFSGIDPNYEATPLEIAYQFYLESLILKNIT